MIYVLIMDEMMVMTLNLVSKSYCPMRTSIEEKEHTLWIMLCRLLWPPLKTTSILRRPLWPTISDQDLTMT